MNVHFAAGSLRPRQHRKPFNVVARNRIVRRHRRHARKPPQFFQRFFLYFVRHSRRFDLLPQFFRVPRAFILLTQFFLDGLHLLAQVVFALGLLYPVLHFGLDLVAQLLDFQLFRQMLVDLLQTHANVGGLERVLLVSGRKRRQRRRDEIHQAARLFNVHGHRGELIRQRRRSGNNLLKQSQNIALQSLDFRTLGRNRFRNRVHSCPHKWRQLGKLHQPHPLQAFGENKQALVGHFYDFVHDRQGPDGVQIGRLRRVDASFALRHHYNRLVLAQRIDQLDRAFPAHGQGQNGVRK